MGVRGLQSFLKNNQEYFADAILVSNSSLVIDANNLLCLLFAESCLDVKSPHFRSDIYGGNFVGYAEIVREFFKNLDKCNITPILVFDGSTVGKEEIKDFVGTKEKQLLKRGLDRFNIAQTMDENPSPQSSDVFLPQRLNVLFKSIVIQLGYQIVFTPYEADTHIARLANELKCPVFTNDSDFIIYNLDKGFIMIDSFNWKNPIKDKTGRICIDALIYNQSKVAKNIRGFRIENMPLLSVLLGNDYVEPGTFDPAIESICGQYYNGHLNAQSFNHRKIANLLTWMGGRSLDHSIDYILSMVPHSHRQKLNQLIRMFLKNYKIELADDFLTELSRIYPKTGLAKGALPEQAPPCYIRKLLEQDDLAGVALDIVFKNPHYNYAILDDFQLPTSSIPMFRPYSLALVLLRSGSYENLTTIQRQTKCEKDSFFYYDRVGNQYTKIILKPLNELEHFGSLENLDCYSMILLEPALKRTLLSSCFRFNSDEMNLMIDTVGQVFKEPYVSDVAICFMLIKYIALETRTSPKPQFVDAILLCYFYYAAMKRSLNQTSISDEAYCKLLFRLRPHSTKNNGIQYQADGRLYRRIVHMISQLHSAYRGFTLVNTLLGKVYSVMSSDNWFNGVLIFRLTRMLRTAETSLEAMCEGMAVVVEAAKSIRVQVHCDEG